MFHSIKTRLTMTFILFFFIVEGIQLLGIYFFFNDAFLKQKENTIIQAFDEINDEQLDEPDILEDVIAVMEDYEATANLYFCLTDRDTGNVLYSTNDSINKNIDFTDVNNSRYDEEAEPKVIHGYNSNNWLVLYRSILTANHCYNTVIWTCYEAAFYNTIWGLAPIFLLTILASALVGGFLAFSFSNHLVKPIKQMDVVASQIAMQDFSTTLPKLKRKDELYRLSVSINKMSNQLEQDMNELKEINLQLEADIKEKERIDQMRRQFLSNVSHDLKTPLAILSSYAEMLLTEGEHINKADYLNVILEEAHEMSSMVGKLLELSRLEHDAEQLTLTPADISELLKSLLDTRAILFEQKNIKLIADIHPDLVCLADEAYLAQAFDNYLSNAVKYTDNNGCCKVSLTLEGENILYSVENTCPPLEEEEMSSIWSSFYKVDKARKHEKNMSVGLGLYIVKTITLAHHGAYNVENTPTGIRFSISLPRYVDNK